MTQPIWYDSSETGAPSLNNAAGSLLEVLRACLVNGFGARAISSISVAAGVATVTSAAHGFGGMYGKLVLVAGASQALLNGRKQPGNVTTNTFTFPAPGVADGTYTGAITVRRSPLGWAETHSAGNVSIFSRTDPQATTMQLRVNDSLADGSTATEARWLVVESSTDVSTFIGAAPTDAQIAGGAGAYVHKGPSSATAKQWCVVGDERAMWLFTRFDSLPTGWRFAPFFFGDGVPYFAADAYFAVILAALNPGSGANSQTRACYQTGFNTQPAYNSLVASRARSGVGSSVVVSLAAPSVGASLGGFNEGQSSTQNVTIHKPVWLIENDGQLTIRGEVPGLASPLARSPFANLQILENVDGSGKTFLSIWHNSQSAPGNVLIDLTGPWY